MRKRIALLLGILMLLGMYAYSAPQLVKNQLNTALSGIFPEIREGYIDLNQNGKVDTDTEVSEIIPESSVKDSKLQAKEVLDFIIKNFAYIPLDKLTEVKQALQRTSEAIPELIALNYIAKIDTIITKKKELEAKGLYLTPSALRAALEKESSYITTMVQAYKKENRELESSFIKARDSLFTMIEQGYPLPTTLSEEDRDILVSIMINTIIKEKKSNPARVKVAIKTLGRLKAESAVSYLISIINQPSLRIESIRALGNIGSPGALKRLLSELDTETNVDIKVAIIEAIGSIGSKSSIDRLVSILNPEGGKKVEEKILIATLDALANTAARGNATPGLQKIFSDYVTSTDPQIRMIAIRGLSNYKNAVAGKILFDLLKKEGVSEVRIELIKALNKLNATNTVPALTAILRNKNTPGEEKKAILEALGKNPGGDKALTYIVKELGSEDDSISEAAKKSLISQFGFHPIQVTGALNKALVQYKDERTLEAATDVVARLGNEDSLPYLVGLLSSQYPMVKKNVTWALYRIHSASNPRVVDELKKLVKSDTEMLAVRINAVRALGAIRLDSPQKRVWETLLEIAKVRNPKFSTLRYYAIEALGDLRSTEPQVVETVSKIAERENDITLKVQAVKTLRKFALQDSRVENSLVKVFKKTKDKELKILIVEALGDMYSDRTAELASQLLKGNIGKDRMKRVLYALYQVGGKAELSVIIDAASDADLRGYIEGLLENANPKVLMQVINRRMGSESNSDILEMLQTIKTRIEESY